MTLHVDLSGVKNHYRLCLVHGTWAFFTRLALDRQWGDGWERTPYERYAGAPYAGEPDQILKLAFDGPLLPPEAGTHGAAYSAEAVNEGRAPWLRTESYLGAKPVHIMAGVTLDKFVELVELAGGTVYVPLGWGNLIPAASQVEPEMPGRSA